ncbi:HAMP domain-containing sensor histidine kinase [Clostridium frigidicarnis]|uniref:histidine kinase n=2 Tax=Clostridium frigidicarnis TaxID=84698 RepID=A0A1I0ZW95_9CLOT|nr:sensor histidine kinase [Clostridium frigidicarnis]SFB29336.1 Histidine kinase-, DNA gyrase B-, and HSP90-like ATPase [Clostridium frigidicarnis]
MATKLISNKKKYIISFIVLIILLIASIGMVFSYSHIENNVETYKKNEAAINYAYMDIKDTNYLLYYKILQSKENKKVNPSDMILNINEDNNNYTYKFDFDEEVYKFQDVLNKCYGNLEYYCIDKESNTVESNIKDTQVVKVLSDDTIINDKFTNTTTERLRERYKFYVVMDFDENGHMDVRKQYGINMDLPYKGKYSDDFKPIKNATFIYAYSNKLSEDKNVEYTLNSRYAWMYQEYSNKLINIGLAFGLILGLIIPYSKSKQILGMSKIFKIPFEILVAIPILIGYFVYNTSTSVIMGIIQRAFISFLRPAFDNRVFDNIVDIVNIGYWFVYIFVAFSVIVVLKHIWDFGIVNYFKENLLIYKIEKIISEKFEQVDLRDKSLVKIIIIVTINFLIMILICRLFIIGKLIAFIYTICLFKLITNKLNKVRYNYTKLFSATHKIANGELDVDIDEDLGVFNPLKLELQNIQNGFKNAVDEEVKSEKMKTQLISNVSHDLKTPLTSIITYVDLLKDGSLTEDKRKAYLDTLDKKSQRLKELIEDLFEVSKATSGNISLNINDVDVISLMKQTLLELDDKIKKSNLIVKTHFNSSKVILPLDGQCMFRVFENLILNITKYAMIGSRVYINIFNRDDKVEIIFKNMSQSEIDFNVDDIVERFVRGDKARNTEGSGLGLAIAKSFVEVQGGKFLINVDGDLFKVTIIFNKK